MLISCRARRSTAPSDLRILSLVFVRPCAPMRSAGSTCSASCAHRSALVRLSSPYPTKIPSRTSHRQRTALSRNVLRAARSAPARFVSDLKYFSSELNDMRLAGAERATLYLEPAVPTGNRYRWNRIWQYPAFPKADKEWEGLFQAGRWEYSLTGPWPVPTKPVE